MHKKTRRQTAYLYRSHWTPKGAGGNTHGYSTQTYVGSLPLSSTAVPDKLRALLSAEEQRYVESSICLPAREVAAREHRDAEQRRVDPVWRLEEAERLVVEAAQRSAERRVAVARVRRLQDALASVQLMAPPEPAKSAERRSDALQEALVALRAAAAAVRDGAYGHAPETGIRSTRTYRLWSEIYDTVSGDDSTSLLRALQARGFAKSRQR